MEVSLLVKVKTSPATYWVGGSRRILNWRKKFKLHLPCKIGVNVPSSHFTTKEASLKAKSRVTRRKTEEPCLIKTCKLATCWTPGLMSQSISLFAKSSLCVVLYYLWSLLGLKISNLLINRPANRSWELNIRCLTSKTGLLITVP